MRAFLTFVLPLLLPTVLFVAWLAWRARNGGPPLDLSRLPWPWLAGSGVALLVLVLGAWALSGGAPPGTAYVPARMEGGRVIGGEAVDPR
ncbi:DUF6111 family protein [Azospirillum halopraeferens]|uniref:DUF6111 family protein n=1 Tax=Azospirillum halopraeferens TaxID=34010 RepID=UPI000416B825|nr:DUF6111 family protein [Azospirillum halopraeferens]